MITYQIDCQDIFHHEYEVKLTIPSPAAQGQRLQLPAWIPGSYMVRDFAKNITALRATDAQGNELTLTKLDKQSWQLAPAKGPITVVYRVYALDYSVRSAYLASDAGFFNGTSLYLQVVGQDQQPCQIELLKPAISQCEHWQVATGLPIHSIDDGGFGVYRANSWWDAIDCPVLLANYTRVDFSVAGQPFSVALVDDLPFDTQRLKDDLSKICAHHIRLFGAPAPFKHYWFLTLLADNAFGGLEHSNSTLLMFERSGLPNGTIREPNDSYRNFLSLCSHELFHAWLVKRIRPACFTQPDLSAEVYTRQLWIYEGFTSYYDDLSLVRAKVISPTSYLQILGENLTRLARNPGRLRQTVSDSSFDAWTRFYQQDENARNAIVSYYLKGGFIALCLDLTLRQQNKASLDEVLKLLWQRHGENGTDDNVIETLCLELGVDCRELLQRAVNSTDELPIEALLARHGMRLVNQPNGGSTDKGGKLITQPVKHAFGAVFAAETTGLRIQQVQMHSPAARAGLMKNDLLLALNHIQTSDKTLQTLLDRQPTGSEATLHVLRRGRLWQMNLPIEKVLEDSVMLEIFDEQAVNRWLELG